MNLIIWAGVNDSLAFREAEMVLAQAADLQRNCTSRVKDADNLKQVKCFEVPPAEEGTALVNNEGACTMIAYVAISSIWNI